MFPLMKSDQKANKCRFTHGFLPPHVDEKQPPLTRKPFASIIKPKWFHTLDLVLPSELVDIVAATLDSRHGPLHYAKVMMSLFDIIDGDFFTSYCKIGNIMMLSEGRPGVDNLFSLHDGILRLELDKATYERAGLEGKPIADGGLKHKTNRYDAAIELNLRLPSMLRGKKGFERIKWAFRNVLNQSLTWLFLDRAPSKSESSPTPLDKHHPIWIQCEPEQMELACVTIPHIISSQSSQSLSFEVTKDGEYMADLEEWISLVALGSPRITSRDAIDPYLCRYAVPASPPNDAELSSSLGEGNLTRIRWHGFIPSSFLVSALIITKKQCHSQWAALQAHGFRGEGLTILKLAEHVGMEDYMEWEHSQSL